jgi:protein required for attachment to host cells
MANYEIVRPFRLLEQLGRDHHRAKQDHAREAPKGATRRRIEADMAEIAQRFERVLEHWAAAEDEELRAAWRRYLYDGAPPPQGPDIEPPCLFRGVTEAGARVEVRPAPDGGHDVLLDGTRNEHSAVPWQLEVDAPEPLLVGQIRCREVFDAPDEALRAVARFVATAGSVPPWRWARELFEDGLIDSEFDLTPRGRRALMRVDPPAASGPHHVSYCVVAADAGRARILALESAASPDGETPTSLIEITSLTNPQRRSRDSDVQSDARPGPRGDGSSDPRHAVDDRRQSRRQDADRKFSELVAAQAEAVWHHYPGCHVVVVAPPGMLGHLRPAIARHRTGAGTSGVSELDKDLTRLAPSALHDTLAEAGLLPARGRAAPGTSDWTAGPVGAPR